MSEPQQEPETRNDESDSTNDNIESDIMLQCAFYFTMMEELD